MLVDIIVQQELARMEHFSGKAVVMVDTLRASSTIVTAMTCGAKQIIPAPDVASARQLSRDFDNCLLAGERGGEKIPGFHLGNSPLEYSWDRVAGKTLIMTTTNGTRALLAAKEAEKIIVVSFLNAKAAAKKLILWGLDVLILCSGTKGSFSLEDFAAAGMLVERLGKLARKLELGDAARAAAALHEKYSGDLEGLLCASEHGRSLAMKGHSKDLKFCAQQDIFDVVPQLEKGRLTLQ